MLFTYEQIANLNETEMSVYYYVIKNMNGVVGMSIRDLSRKSHVSTATIMRFCHKLHCDGYSEFKVKLKLFNQKNIVLNKDNELEMLMNFFEFSKTTEFQEKIKKTVAFIKKAKSICFLGIGTSGILGKYGARFFSNVGYYSQYIEDPYYPVPTNEFQDNLVIVLSVSGENSQVIDQLKMYQSRKSNIVAITNKSNSTIDKIADISIYYYVEDIILPQTYNITSQVPVIYILERIARELHKEDNL